ncbi:MAG: threonine synthase [Clostridia bacterium]|nr:threonine synthase [Clostridia bacterium]
MNYISTRQTGKPEEICTASKAIMRGLAPDGGLYVPDSIPSLDASGIRELCKMDYAERAARVLSWFLNDYTEEELLEDCKAAYRASAFPGGPAPLVRARDGVYALELWHGPTAAFKDMALQIMPRLLSRALGKNGETRTALILVATSGDKGKAALEGYKDIPQIRIQVFYPEKGVSRVQQLQMATQTGDNVSVCAIRGNFDDAQSGVKAIFSDRTFAKTLNARGTFLSSANSINWGRLAPQIVYYISAYCDLLNRGEIKGTGESVDFCVPTGNFGNIFAAYLAKRMGLPIRRLICASNRNDVLTEFFSTGRYDRKREFHLTMSPSMDILISSNLERLLWAVTGPEKTAACMEQLRASGEYTVDRESMDRIREVFTGFSADESQTAKTIRTYFEKYGYLCDTHTAVALSAADRYLQETGSKVPLIVDSTASPYKFAADVCASLDPDAGKPEPLDALDVLKARTGTEIPYPLAGIGNRAVRFTRVADAADMPKEVLAFAEA